MGIIESIVLSLSLAIDATAVSITNGLVYTHLSKKKMILSAILFGVFQAVMPLLGYSLMLLSSLNEKVDSFIKGVDHWIAFALLLFLGGKMIIDAIKEIRDSKKENTEEETEEKKDDVSLKTLLVQAVATSIDAFAVGISLFAASNVQRSQTGLSIWWTFLIIGVITFICSILGSVFGKVIGNVVKKIAPIIGGLVLIGIGVSIVVEHLL